MLFDRKWHDFEYIHEILLNSISVAAPSTVAPASPKALGGSMTSKGVPASRMRMRLRRAQTTDHGFNLPSAGLNTYSIIFNLPFGKTKSLVGLDYKLICPRRGRCYILYCYYQRLIRFGPKPLKGFLRWRCAIQVTLTLIGMLLQELQRYKDTIRCHFEQFQDNYHSRHTHLDGLSLNFRLKLVINSIK